MFEKVRLFLASWSPLQKVVTFFSTRKLFDNKKPVVIVIVLFVAVCVWLWATPARSSELHMEGGSALLRGETPALGLQLRWPEQGPVGTDWEAGFLLSGESTHYRSNSNAVTLYGMLVDGYKNFEAGLGFAYTNVDWEYTCKGTFSLMVRYRFTDRIATQWRHFSSAGTCKPNAGRDFLTLSWRF